MSRPHRVGRDEVARTALLALVVAGTMATLDLALDLVARPGALRNLEEVGRVTVAATALLLPLLLAAALAVVVAARRAGRSPATALQIAAAASVVSFLYAGLGDLFRLSLHWRQLASAALFLALVAAGCWALLRAVRASDRLRRRLGTACLLAALLLQVTVWSGVVLHFLPGAQGLVLCVLLVAAAAALWRLRRRPAVGLPAAGMLTLLPALLLLVPTELERRPAAAAAGEPVAAGPPVILITIDTLRADELALYRPDAVRAPALEALAEDSLLYEHAYAPAPWTLPSMVSLHTGVSPRVHGAIDTGQTVPATVPTLASILETAGYRTAAIGRNPHLIDLASRFGYHSFYPQPPSLTLGAKILRRVSDHRFQPRPTTAELTARTRAWLRRGGPRPFFLWLHYFDPHTPYEVHPDLLAPGRLPESLQHGFQDEEEVRSGFVTPTPEERYWIRELYRSEIRLVDRSLRGVLDVLRDLDLYEQSLIVVTSDHGEEFWEHGGYLHGHSVYDELLRVPLLIKPPGGTAARRVPGRVSTLGLFATILDWTGVAAPELPYAEPPLPPRAAPAARPPVTASGLLYFENRTALVHGGHKYVVRHQTGAEELYDLAADPGEQRSLLAADPSAALPYRQLAAAEAARTAAQREHLGLAGEADAVAVDPALEEELRSLGYLR